MKKILVLPVKNEEWILEKSLAYNSQWADNIIIADQNSSDKTMEICKKFPKVTVIPNTEVGLHQSHARQMLLDFVRKTYGNDNIIFALDADEILSANAINNKDFWNKILSLKPGQSAMLQWIMLWRSINKYRNDNSRWSNNWMYFIFRDNGKFNYPEKRTSEPRMPEEFMLDFVKYEEVKVLHFEFVDWQRMLSKQRRYRVMDFLERESFLNIVRINRMYWETKNETKLGVSNVPAEWFSGYKEIFAEEDLTLPKSFYWYNNSVLEKFRKYGVKEFAWLDIWDKDWGQDFPDPRSKMQIFYHKNLQSFISDDSFLYKIYSKLRGR